MSQIATSSTHRARRGPTRTGLAVVLAVALALVVSGTPSPVSAAPRVGTVTVSAQTGTLNVGTGGSVTYVVTVTKGNTQNLSVALAATGLPAGASASFNPTGWTNWAGATGASRTSTLTVTTTAGTPGGDVPFTVTATRVGTASDNASGGATLSITRIAQSITFDPLAGKTFGDPDFTVAATATSGLATTFTAADACTVTGATVHLTGAGSCTITAEQAGNGTYAPATPVPQTFAVAQGPQTIAFGPLADKNIYSPDFLLTGTSSSGLPVQYSASGECTVTGNLVHVTGVAGSCTITPSQPGDANYLPADETPGQTFAIVSIPPTADLYVTTGSTTLAGQAVTVWGYNSTNAPVTAPGGPTIEVTEGDFVVLLVHNGLAEQTSLVVRGQPLPTDQVGIEPGASKAYVFTAGEPGTFLYEAGPIANAQHQVAMGLYGTLIVQPSSGAAYGSTDQAVVVVSEIDPALNNSASPAAFDMRNFSPKYTLINGTVYPGSPELATVDPGAELLLRYVNAGIDYRSMSVLGANQRIVGDDGHALAQPYSVVAQTVGPGQTFDAIVDVPAAAAAGTKLAVFDASLQLRNRNRRPATASATVTYGGAMSFVTIDGTPSAADTVGPVSSFLVATANTIDASISDITTGNSNVTAAEYFLDSPGANGSGIAMSGTFPSTTVAVDGVFAAPLTGTHMIYVHGKDQFDNWGPLVAVRFSSDNVGPATSGVTISPNPANGSAGVALHATGSDAAAGGSFVTAAEYTIDGGAPTPMTLNTVVAVTASLDVTIAPSVINGLSEGSHDVGVRTQDAAGNWGPVATISLTVDTIGPVTSGVSASPNPNGGLLGINSSTPAVRVLATADDPAKIVRAEGFIDTVGGLGTGFLLVPIDGVFDETNEAMSVDIPLSTIVSLAVGDHTIYVRAKDAAGNWGTTSSTILTIDKTPPMVSSITRVGPSPATASTVAFTVTFSEPVVGVTTANLSLVQGGGLFGAAITSMTGSGATRTVTVSTGSGGGTLGLNVSSAAGIKDIAGNPMPLAGLPVVGETYSLITPALYFSTVGNANPQGVGGTADDADILYWSGTAFSRSIDVSTIPTPLPAGANVDGFDRVDATHFYMSFTDNVTIVRPGPDLTVADEDVVYYSAGTWSLFFDGSARAVGNTDLDAISIVSGTLYFSTSNTTVPSGAGGTGDDADIYRWNGNSTFTRMVDASAVGWSTANVDGLVWVDATHVYLSYSADTSVPGVGAVQDEDVVYDNGGTWSVYFDGTGKALTSADLDTDAFDIP